MGFFVDALSLADMVDGTVLVVRQGYSSACDINDAVDALNKAKSKFLGCILNNMWGFPGSRSRYGHGYGYGYGATAKQAGKPTHPADSEKGGGHV
jgi:Mrp family chromosome partitioning ATPase